MAAQRMGIAKRRRHPKRRDQTSAKGKSIQVLANQPIEISQLTSVHRRGNLGGNMFPGGCPPNTTKLTSWAVLLADSTIFSTLFGRDESLEFWKTLPTKR